MRRIEATPERPIYTIGYLYKDIPWTLNSHNFWGFNLICEKKLRGRTMEGTDDLEFAKKVADELLTKPQIVKVIVTKSDGNYNAKEVYIIERNL